MPLAPGLGATASLLLLASIVVSLLAAGNALTPLYAVYQRHWGFSPITTTVIYGVYTLAVLASLLVFGRISDHIGRRPLLIATLVAQAGSMVMFAEAGSVSALMIARVVQGVTTGVALSTIGAGLLDFDRPRGGFLNSLAPSLGTAGGVLLASLIVQYLPAPTRLVYYLLLGVFALQVLGVLALRETVTRKPGALASMIPEIKLPRVARGPMAVATPVLCAVWGLYGFYGSLCPAVIRGLVHSASAVWGGLPMFVLNAAAVFSVLVLRKTTGRKVMVIGIVTLVVGVAITVVSIGSGAGGAGAASGFLVGSAIAGFGLGSSFQGGNRMVLPLAESHERAGLVSLLWVVAYLGSGVPSVIAGFLVVHGSGLVDTTREYGAAVVVLATVAMAGLLVSRRPTRVAAEARP